MVKRVANNKFRFSYVLVIILVGILLFGLGFTKITRNNPNDVYRVYIDGEVIGTVRDKEEFDSYINTKEEAIKRRYGVDKVYMPDGVIIKKVTTYDNNIDSNEDVYKKLVKLKQFTVEGIVITVKNKEVENYQTKYIYTLNKEIFDEAIIKLIKSFVEEEDYVAYMNSTQKEIIDTGSIIRNIEIDEDITYKKDFISIDEEIFIDSSTLAKYLLYGTLDEQST